MRIPHSLNLRDLGDVIKGVPRGIFLRCGKLAVLTPEQCAALCQEYHIGCVIDLRTPIEVAEYPDPLPPEVEYLQIPLLKDATVGITHETGSDPLTVLRKFRNQPERLMAMIPDFDALYGRIVTDTYSRTQLDRVVEALKERASRGVCTLFHCTAGKDRTGIVAMALLVEMGYGDKEIERDFMRTNRHAFLPALKKSFAAWLFTRNWTLTIVAFHALMAERKLIRKSLKLYRDSRVSTKR